MKLTESVKADKYTGQSLEYPKFPIRFDALNHQEITEPPFLGEHTDQVLQEILGYSSAKVQKLWDD